jgi:hypothetical protein
MGALVILASWAADPAFASAQWHAFAG